ncbi:MAG: MBL fold metallo-hydrolase [Acidobacteriota bacterium]
MKMERFEVKGLAQYSYVLSDAGEAVVIDPMRDIDGYLAYAHENGLRITHIMETHIHADYASGAVALAVATGAELALSAYDEGERFSYQMPHRALHDGDAVSFGDVRLQALHTPGHTPEHLAFLQFDLGRSKVEPVAMFSGDFLFVGSLGRPDLLGEQAKLGLARELYRSVQQRIAPLPDGLEIYPGHGAGSLCGAGMGENPETTLGYERRTNPFFGYGEEEFVTKILASVPAMPDYYPRMKELNSVGAAALDSLPQPKALSPEALAAKLADPNVMVLDLRRPEAFGGAHIAGAINIGSEGNLSLWAGWLLDAAKEIVLVNDSGDDEPARRSLLRVGLDRVVGYLDGGIASWVAEGLEFARTTQITVDELDAAVRTGDALVLDVRTDGEWANGAIAGALHIPLGKLPGSLDQLEKERAIAVVCGSGYRSSIAASLLARKGFTHLGSLSGGLAAWQRRHGEAAAPCSSGNRAAIAQEV